MANQPLMTPPPRHLSITTPTLQNLCERHSEPTAPSLPPPNPRPHRSANNFLYDIPRSPPPTASPSTSTISQNSSSFRREKATNLNLPLSDCPNTHHSDSDPPMDNCQRRFNVCILVFCWIITCVLTNFAVLTYLWQSGHLSVYPKGQWCSQKVRMLPASLRTLITASQMKDPSLGK